MNEMRKSMSIALCGLLGALMCVTMLLGSILPLASVLCPAIAGLFLIPALRECGASSSTMLYLVVSVLSLLLLPDKECALLFALLLGLYPLLRAKLSRIALRPLRLVCKLVFCNVMLCLIGALLLFIFAPTTFGAELTSYGALGVIGLLLLANGAFFLYDTCLRRFAFLYEVRLRAALFRYQGR